MKIEEEVFLKKEIDKDKLVPYGFIKEGGVYRYSEMFPAGDFRADITVTEDGYLSGKVYDLESDEEYMPVHIENRFGPFVAAVREEYRKILIRIADRCCATKPFIFGQTNRIAGAIKEIYGEVPDHPFEKLPDAAVFRYPGNRKWYGLVMDRKKSKVSGSGEGEDDPVVEVLNVKTDPEKIDEILGIPGIYPGYHMNRANWISIILDDTVPDETVMRLIDVSREYAVNAGRKMRTPGETAYWIIPANPGYCDIDELFAKKKGIRWTQRSRVAKGDRVFIYVGAPVSAVRYECVVTDSDIPYYREDRDPKIRKAMMLDLLREYPPDVFTMKRLKELGIRSVRGARTVTAEFISAVREADRPDA